MTTHHISNWETWKKLCDSVRFMFVDEIDPRKEFEFGIDLGGGNSEDFIYDGDVPKEE